MSRKNRRNLVCKNGVWYVVLRVKGKKVWYRAGKSESEARKLRNELKYKNDLGKLSYAEKVTLFGAYSLSIKIFCGIFK
ncbi:MAG: hypothetical protein ACOY40_09085 [Bacillota bacterium]